MPPCPMTDPVACDDGNAQTAQQRYPCRSGPFPPCLALIEHKADPNYDAVATRMPATLGLHSARMPRARGSRAQAGTIHQSLVLRPLLCCSQQTVGPFADRPSGGPQALDGDSIAPSRTTRPAPQGTRRPAPSGGVKAHSINHADHHYMLKRTARTTSLDLCSR